MGIRLALCYQHIGLGQLFEIFWGGHCLWTHRIGCDLNLKKIVFILAVNCRVVELVHLNLPEVSPFNRFCVLGSFIILLVFEV